MADLAQTHRPPFDAIRPPAGDPPFLHLCWMLHNQCNHRCSYCSEVNWGGSHRWLKFADATDFVDRALRHYDGRRVLVSFTGGEPTLWPEFGPFVEWLANRGVLIGMTTNATKPRAFFEKYAKFFDWISFSYHPEFTRNSKFLENVLEAAKHTQTTVRVMMPDDDVLWKRSADFIAEAEALDKSEKYASNVWCEAVPIALGFGTAYTRPTQYSSEREEFLRAPARVFESAGIKKEMKSPHSRLGFSHLESPENFQQLDTSALISRNQTDFRGWSCDIGLEQLFIDHAGIVARAGCRVGGNLGHISQRNLNFPTKSIRCVKAHCHCITDILTSKRAPAWEEKFGMERLGAVEKLKHRFALRRHDFFERLQIWKEKEAAFKKSGQTRSWTSRRDWGLYGSANLLLFATGAVFSIITRVQSVMTYIFWSRPLRKPFYFVRFQYYKRILRRSPSGQTPRQKA